MGRRNRVMMDIDLGRIIEMISWNDMIRLLLRFVWNNINEKKVRTKRIRRNGNTNDEYYRLEWKS
jgi:hypothetical protein